MSVDKLADNGIWPVADIPDSVDWCRVIALVHRGQRFGEPRGRLRSSGSQAHHEDAHSRDVPIRGDRQPGPFGGTAQRGESRFLDGLLSIRAGHPCLLIVLLVRTMPHLVVMHVVHAAGSGTGRVRLDERRPPTSSSLKAMSPAARRRSRPARLCNPR